VQQPWNNLVITSVIDIPSPPEGQVSTVFTVSIKEIGDEIWKQLGATQNPGLVFKIRRAALWLTQGTYFAVTFCDLQRSTQDSSSFEATIEDTAAKNHFAKVGWRWSAADSSVPYESSGETSASKIVLSIKVPSQSTCLLHMQLVWRAKIFSPIGLSTGTISPLFQCRSKLSTEQQRTTQSIQVLNQSLNRDQSQILSSLDELCGLLRDRVIMIEK
jgi:hypothetical protein